MSNLVYWEIPSTDLDESVRFYSALFGWQIEPSMDNYYSFSTADADDDSGASIGGGINLVEAMPEVCIEVYIGVDDIAETLSRAEELGGRVLQPKNAVGNDYGYVGFFSDPCGCRIGVWSRD
jgi:predicted enzyme related to lactoylglutathione lyase